MGCALLCRCPNPSCQALIERVPASPGDAPSGAANGHGAAAQHRHQHYYRCAMCSKDFCDECRSTPYHTGFTCQQHAAPQCLFCDKKVRHAQLVHQRQDGDSVTMQNASAYSTR
jgi:hypothetical protein